MGVVVSPRGVGEEEVVDAADAVTAGAAGAAMGSNPMPL